MRIILIDPPFYRLIGYYNRYFPLGLAYLGAVLLENGHTVLINDSDCNINPSKIDFARLEDSYPLYLSVLQDDDHHIWKEIMESIHDFKPDIIGITVWTPFAASAFKVASLCNKYDKDIPVVMGGPHVSIKYEEVLKICPDVDFLVRGEGEATFAELAGTLQTYYIPGRSRSYELNNKLSLIKGISYRQNGEFIHNQQREFIKDLDSIPLPARDLLINKDTYSSEDMGLLMTSRGCPYDCSYCATSIWQRKTRFRSVDNIMEELKLVINNYGTTQFTFKDDSFTVNRKRVVDFCDRLAEENININWDCNTRVNLIDEGILRKMKAAGCNSIKVGIESGSEKILGLMKKRIAFDQSRKTAALLKKTGIHWTGYFLMGIPTETKEDVYMTLKFMRELRPDYASISVYEPFPGTELFDIGLEKGLVANERTLEDFYTISPKYYYVKDIKRRVDTMNKEEFEALETEMKEAFHKYNMGFSKLAKRAMSRSKTYLREPKILLDDLKKFWGLMK